MQQCGGRHITQQGSSSVQPPDGTLTQKKQLYFLHLTQNSNKNSMGQDGQSPSAHTPWSSAHLRKRPAFSLLMTSISHQRTLPRTLAARLPLSRNYSRNFASTVTCTCGTRTQVGSRTSMREKHVVQCMASRLGSMPMPPHFSGACSQRRVPPRCTVSYARRDSMVG